MRFILTAVKALIMTVKRKLLKFSMALFATLSATLLYAQPNGGGGGQGQGGSPPDGTGGAIDSGAVILLVGIAAYSHQKLRSFDILNQE